MSLLLAFAATTAAVSTPQVPPQVQVIAESGRLVMRTFTDSPEETPRPLYTYDRDTAGRSNCVDACAAAWPPLAAPADARPVGDWSAIARPDGSRQWAFRGKPVYLFAKDKDSTATGDDVGGVWHLLPTLPAS